MPDPATPALCLEFANTDLAGYRELVAWGRRVGLLSAAEARAVTVQARRRPTVAAAGLRQARRLREALGAVVTAVAARRPAPREDLDTLNAAIAGALARSRLTPRRGGFAWERVGDRRSFDLLLWPIARSAAEILTSPDLDAVRQCAAPDCARLFLDVSRNQSRRWCDMAGCGNRQKARRHYARKRSTRARSAGGKSYSPSRAGSTHA